MSTDYAVPPGEYLEEWILEGTNVPDIVKILETLEMNDKDLDNFIKGEYRVSNNLAEKLELLTSIPRGTWVKLDNLYQEDIERLHHS